MTANESRIPARFIGGIRVGVATTKGSFEYKAIGMELRIDEESPLERDEPLSCEISINLFVDPPTVSIPRLGTMVVDKRTRTVQITTASGIDFQGKFADDFQSFSGVVSLGRFQLLDVYGEFNDQPVVFRAE